MPAGSGVGIGRAEIPQRHAVDAAQQYPALTRRLRARLPGQWFQLESGLHYNWYRHYDPTLGRYTQPDPLSFVDGASVYSYVNGSPLRYVDKDGRTSGVEEVTLCGLFPEACVITIVVVSTMIVVEGIKQFMCKVEVDRTVKKVETKGEITLFPPIDPRSGCSCNCQQNGVFARANAGGSGYLACKAAASIASSTAKTRAGLPGIHHTQCLCKDSRGKEWKFTDKKLITVLN